jgi:UDP-3-O-[3-hydroxymyristoyl] glucosamine N-acyltransferase
MKLTDIATAIGAELKSPAGAPNGSELTITRISPIDIAMSGELTFLANDAYDKFLQDTRASAVILKDFREDLKIPQLIHPKPYVGFAKAAHLFVKSERGQIGIHEAAHISSKAKIGKNLTAYPFCYVGDGAVIGDNVVLYPGVFVGEKTEIGDDSILFANVVVNERCKLGKKVILHAGTVIGADGFGFAPDAAGILKVPQLGDVVIEDDVEIGALSTVDRAALGTTLIKKNAKLDDHVHIAHNVEVGESCLFAAFVGIAGSSKIGDHVMMGGHSGVSGHLKVPSKSSIGAMSGVVNEIDESGAYFGFPAQPSMQWRRQLVYVKRLAEYEKRIAALEKKLGTERKGTEPS